MKLNNNNFANFINKNYLFENKPQIALAVSGGPDSMALAHLLNKWVEKNNGKLLCIIIDHKIRDNSLEEAYWTQYELKKNKIKSYIISLNKNKIDKKNMDEARNNRFNALIDFCKKRNILHLFFGHHYDDNIETYIIRKVAGSDFQGLQSISEIKTLNKINILRPLLKFSKKNILEYNYKNKINFVEDPSNQNKIYTRVCIRSFINEEDKSVYDFFQKEFKHISKQIPSYNYMIWSNVINIIKLISSKKIAVNFTEFLKLDNIIAEKLVSIFYVYFYGNKKRLRNTKILKLLTIIKKNNFKFYNIRSMILKNDNNLLVFSAKK